jgi:hypothetical protein
MLIIHYPVEVSLQVRFNSTYHLCHRWRFHQICPERKVHKDVGNILTEGMGFETSPKIIMLIGFRQRSMVLKGLFNNHEFTDILIKFLN